MSKFTVENYINIKGWMITRLKLKGNELLLYAIVFGYSQDGRSQFLGSINYIAEALSSSRTTAIAVADKLVDKKLIFKGTGTHKGQECNSYYVNMEKIGSTETVLVQKLDGGSTVSVPNIDNNNIDIYNTPEIFTEKEFLDRWSKARMHFDKLPTNISRLINSERTDFDNLLKDYKKEDFDRAISGLFFQKTFESIRVRPTHFLKLENFETYLNCWITKKKLFEDKKADKRKTDML